MKLNSYNNVVLDLLGPPTYTSPPAIVTLPASRDRTANLLCQAPTSANLYNPLSLSWVNESGQPLTEEGGAPGVEFPDLVSGVGLSFLRVSGLEVAGDVSVGCVASRSGEQEESALTRISIVGKELINDVTLIHSQCHLSGPRGCVCGVHDPFIMGVLISFARPHTASLLLLCGVYSSLQNSCHASGRIRRWP